MSPRSSILTAGLLALSLAACEPAARQETEATMAAASSAADAKALVDRYYAAASNGNRDAYAELFTADVQLWAPGETLTGAQALLERDMTWLAAFPDARVTSIRKIADGPFVVSENRFSGTHTAPLVTPEGEIAPTGKPIDLPYVAVFEVTGGKLKAQRIYYDQMTLMTQLGLAE